MSIKPVRTLADTSVDGYGLAALNGEWAKITIMLPLPVWRLIDHAAEMNGVSPSRFMAEVLMTGASSAVAPPSPATIASSS
jgi:hypothetical protein